MSTTIRLNSAFTIDANQALPIAVVAVLTLSLLPTVQADVHALPLVPDISISSSYRVFVAGEEVPVGDVRGQ